MYEKFMNLLQTKGVITAQVAKDTGIDPSCFSDWKSGKSSPKVDKLLKLAEYFNVPLEYFVKEDG